MATVFFSDVHIGDTKSKHVQLLDYLKSERSTIDKIVIVGDFLDLWVSPLGTDLSLARPFLNYLSTEYPGKVHYILGNHDEDLEPLKGIIPFVHKSLRFPIGDKLGIALHGHVIDPDKYVRTKFAHFMAWFVNKLDKWAHIDTRKSLVSLSEMIANDPYEKLLKEYEQIIVDIFTGKYDYVITGHTHIPCIKKFGDLVYINTGDQMQHSTIVIGKPDGFYLYDYVNKKTLDICRVY